MTPPPGRVVDFHTHAFPDQLAQTAVPKLAGTAGIVPATDGTVRGLLESMDEAGVTVSVVHSIATTPGQAASIRRWALSVRSARIVPFPSVHPASGRLREELAGIAADGFLGVKLHPMYQDFAVDDEAMMPLYETCSDLGLTVLLHAGDDISFPASDSASPRRLAAVRRSFGKLVLVAAHAGGWGRWDEVERHLLGQDIYLELSYVRQYLPREPVRQMILAHRPDRLLFGSDSPWDDQAAAVSYFRSLELPAELLGRILSGNALELLRIKA